MIANLNRTIQMKDASRIKSMTGKGASVEDIAATLDIHVDSVESFVAGMSKAKAPATEKAAEKKPTKRKTAAEKKAARANTPTD